MGGVWPKRRGIYRADISVRTSEELTAATTATREQIARALAKTIFGTMGTLALRTLRAPNCAARALLLIIRSHSLEAHVGPQWRA